MRLNSTKLKFKRQFLLWVRRYFLRFLWDVLLSLYIYVLSLLFSLCILLSFSQFWRFSRFLFWFQSMRRLNRWLFVLTFRLFLSTLGIRLQLVFHRLCLLFFQRFLFLFLVLVSFLFRLNSGFLFLNCNYLRIRFTRCWRLSFCCPLYLLVFLSILLWMILILAPLNLLCVLL